MSAIFHFFPILAVLFYLAASISYLRDLFRRKSERGPIFDGRGMLVAGAAFHAVSLIFEEAGVLMGADAVSGVPSTSFPETLSLIAFILVGSFLLLEARLAIASLGAFVAPLAVVFMLAAGVLFHLDRGARPVIEGNALLIFHIALVVLGHTAFVFAFGVSIALIVQESLLKNKKLTLFQRKLPSLRLLDMLNRNLLSGGFVCMSVGIVAGLLFGFANDVEMFGLDSRVLWSMLTLGIYAVLVVGMLLGGLRGRRAAWLSVAGFCSVLLSFVGRHLLGGGFHVH